MARARLGRVAQAAAARAREWLLEMQASVRSVDYVRARPLFAEDVVAFGTFATVVSGRERLEHDQWRNIWPKIRDFTFRLDRLHCLGSDEALCVVVPWDSVGQRDDGQAFDRLALLCRPESSRLPWRPQASTAGRAPGHATDR